MRSRSVLLTLSLALTACGGTAAPFGLAATPTLSVRDKVEAQLRKEAGPAGATSPGAPAGAAGSIGAPGSVPGGPQQLPNTATADAAPAGFARGSVPGPRARQATSAAADHDGVAR